MPKVVNEEALFEAAVAVYSVRGYVEASMAEIAERASINEVTLFRRFGTKASLIEKALTDFLANSAFARLQYTGDLEADLISVVTAYSETNAMVGTAVSNLISEIPRHDELRPIGAVLLTNIARVTEILTRYQEGDRLVPGSPAILLSKLIAPIMMQSRFELAFDLDVGKAFEPADHVTMFLSGLGEG